MLTRIERKNAGTYRRKDKKNLPYLLRKPFSFHLITWLCYMDSPKSKKYSCRTLDTRIRVRDMCPTFLIEHSPREHI